jgi:hypothetical protein
VLWIKESQVVAAMSAHPAASAGAGLRIG